MSVDAGYSAKDIQVLEGLEAVRKTARYVHRVHRTQRTPPPGLRGRRQLRRRGPRRLLHRHRRGDSRRQLRQRHRQRPRHAGGQAPEAEEAGRRGHPHGAARRRQVRRRGIQGLRRTPRRRCLGRQRALEPARGGDQEGRGTLDPDLRLRQADRAAPAGGQDEGHRHDRHLLGGLGHLRDDRLRLRHARLQIPRDRLPQQEPADHPDRRTGTRASQGGVPLRRRHRRLREVPQRETKRPSTRGRSTSRPRAPRGRSRSRCSGTPATPTPCSPSPTTSTPTRAGPTSTDSRTR